MRIAIITAAKDIASMTIKKALVASGEFQTTGETLPPPLDADPVYVFTKNQSHKLYTLSCESIDAEDLDKLIEADLFLFATRHQGAAGVPSLSTHGVGNFGVADYGGKDGALVPAPARHIRFALELLKKHGETLGWDIVQEATHHGPYMEKPVLFVEIGSTKAEWIREDAGAVLAQVILDLISTQPPAYDLAIGFGGQHTTTNFKKVIERSNLAFGHIAAKYAMPSITEGLIEEMLEKTLGSITPSEDTAAEPRPLIVFDWKGMGIKKQEVLAMVEKLRYPYKFTEDFGKEEREPVKNA